MRSVKQLTSGAAAPDLGEKLSDNEEASCGVNLRLLEVSESCAATMSASFSFRPLFLPCFTLAEEYFYR